MYNVYTFRLLHYSLYNDKNAKPTPHYQTTSRFGCIIIIWANVPTRLPVRHRRTTGAHGPWRIFLVEIKYADNRDDGLPWFFEPLHDSTDFWDKQAHNNRTMFKMRTKVSILLSSIPRVPVAVLHGLTIFSEFIKIIICHKTHNGLRITYNRRLNNIENCPNR